MESEKLIECAMHNSSGAFESTPILRQFPGYRNAAYLQRIQPLQSIEHIIFHHAQRIHSNVPENDIKCYMLRQVEIRWLLVFLNIKWMCVIKWPVSFVSSHK